MTEIPPRVVVIGGGPAGLAAVYTLAKMGVPAVCLESSQDWGGLSRTVVYRGFRFDIGGHRFFSKSQEVNALWKEILGDEFLTRPRQSRIYYRNRFFSYPLKAGDALRGLGLFESLRIFGSYLFRQIRPYPETPDFERWTSNLFGDRLYRHFFKAYTEKVWGIPCSQIASEWGAQRIRGLNLLSAIRSALLPPKHGSIKTLIGSFHYPRYGPGQMYEATAQKAEALGAELVREAHVVRIERDETCVKAVIAKTPSGERRYPATYVLSSMPLTDLVIAIDPPLDEEAQLAARHLRYRSLLTVNLILDTPQTIPDTWIYIHDPRIRMGRIQCFKNWSPAMVPDPQKSSLGCEYFVTEGDEVWQMADPDLLTLAKQELQELRLVDPAKVEDGFVVRAAKAYPVFDLGYAPRVAAIRRALAPISNLQPIGRYGMYRYNNMDHSILTGILAARNTQGARYDIWSVNVDQEYQEEMREET